MPFDATPQHPLRELTDLLRHPERWPADFRWDYGHCDHCALELWGVLHEQALTPEAIGMSDDTFVEIFYGCRVKRIYGKSMMRVRPTDVAKAIDRWLAQN